MRIAIDASPAAKEPRTGTELYTLHLILALARLDSAHEYTLLLNEEVPEEFADLPPNFVVRQIPQRRLWAQTRLAQELRRQKPDVFFAPANVIPFVHPPVCVTTVHDVAFHFFPECYSPLTRWYLELTTRFALRAATRVIAVSQATKEDLVRVYGADPARIAVIHSGSTITEAELPTPDRVASTLKRFGITPPYLLFLGRLETKKNVARIVQAFFKLKERGFPHQLVLGGTPGVGFEEVARLINTSPYGIDIVLTGYVGEEKADLYAGAEAFVFPSLYEGFGFPVLEAATYGVPVVTSRTSSLAEVAGKAALLVDPLDVEEIAGAILRVIEDEQLRSELLRLGRDRLAEFDWDIAVSRVVEVLEAAAGQALG
ncbi:MAG TPA: glycosyltransferase family 1 protein [Anaerolineae bacterium]|nr:glycosyltransferase family 1 protein [Anaerolineae bacterium]